jgi:hypothetical protein
MRSRHREQGIGRYRELEELEHRREISQQARARQVANAAWSEALDHVKPMGIAEEPAKRAETVPLSEQPQDPRIMSRWMSGLSGVAAAATIAVALAGAGAGEAAGADVRVDGRTHIQATTNVTKDVDGSIKRGGKEFKPPTPGKAARANLQPGDTVHVSTPQTIDDTDLHIVHESDYYGNWTLGSPGNPTAKLTLRPNNRGGVEGLILQRTNQENTYMAYRISDCQLDTNDGVLKGGWSLSLRNARIKTADSLGTQHELWKGTTEGGSKYDGRNPTIPTEGGAQFMLQEDGLYYAFRLDTPSGKFRRPLRVIGPWVKSAEQAKADTSPGTSQATLLSQK